MLGARFQIQNSGSRVHFYLFKLHRVGGVAAALLLLILGVSGSVMAFSGEIDCLLHPSLFKVFPEGQPLSLSQLASSGASVLHAGESIGTCVPSTRADASYSFIVFGAHHRIPRQIFVDQYTGRVLGSLSAVRFTSIMKVAAFHCRGAGLFVHHPGFYGAQWTLFVVAAQTNQNKFIRRCAAPLLRSS